MAIVELNYDACINHNPRRAWITCKKKASKFTMRKKIMKKKKRQLNDNYKYVNISWNLSV